MHGSQSVAAQVQAAIRDQWRNSWVSYAALPDDLKEADCLRARKGVILPLKNRSLP